MALDELKRTITAIFRNKGAEQISEKDFIYTVSYDLRWFSPKDAQQLMELALRINILKLIDGKLRPGFALSEVSLPLNFSPTKQVFIVEEPEKKEPNLLMEIVVRIAETLGLARRDVIARINKKQAAFGLEIEAAALLVGLELGVPVNDFVPSVKKELAERAKMLLSE